MFRLGPFLLDLKLTLDGLLIFSVGLLAILVIWRQGRHATRRLERLLEEARSELRDAATRRKGTLSRAILFEIDNFYRTYLRDWQSSFQAIDPATCPVMQMPEAKIPGSEPFPILRSSGSLIGEFDGDDVRAIVGFYGMADSYIQILLEYKKCRDKLVLEGSTHAPVALAARAYLQQMRDATPEMIGLTYEVSQRLAAVAAVDFQAPVVAVAAEQEEGAKRDVGVPLPRDMFKEIGLSKKAHA